MVRSVSSIIICLWFLFYRSNITTRHWRRWERRSGGNDDPRRRSQRRRGVDELRNIWNFLFLKLKAILRNNQKQKSY